MPSPPDFLAAVSKGLPACQRFRTLFANFSVSEMVPHLVMQAVDPELFQVVVGHQEAERWMPTVESAYQLLRQDFSGVFIDVDRNWKAQRKWWRRFVRKGADGQLTVMASPSSQAGTSSGAARSGASSGAQVPEVTPGPVPASSVKGRLSSVHAVQRGRAPDPSAEEFVQTADNDADLLAETQAQGVRSQKKRVASEAAASSGAVVRPTARPRASQADSYPSERSADSEELRPASSDGGNDDGELRSGTFAVAFLRLVLQHSVDAGGDYARKWVEQGGSAVSDWHDWAIASKDLDILVRERDRSGPRR